ncbi:MAG TPA: nucleoside-diphosphate sugar epimerase/dehydratase [Burkholderiales bacterium]|nr:nucleoside-diphosphate sugar epimerase/dehydratase [Burkholderiales bacterium]
MRDLGLRRLLAISHDVTAAALAWLFAFLLRFNFDIPPEYEQLLAATLAWTVPVQAAVFLAFGLYRGIWRYASLPDLQRIALAVLVAVMAAAIAAQMAGEPLSVPRSVLVLDPILLLLMMGGSRLAYRAWKEHRLYGSLQGRGQPVLVLGAGDAAVNLVKDLARSTEWRVVGLLDDDPMKLGRVLQGVKVVGRIEELAPVAKRMSVGQCIIAMPSASHSERRRAMELCTAAGVKALTVPAFDDLMSGRVTVSALRRVELDDLLGRDPVQLDDRGLHALLGGRTVMVTGAGGSIGAELCRQIARFGPARLVLLEASEFALYQMEQEFTSGHPGLALVCAIGDVRNHARVEQLMAAYRPAVVFHAAAYKHVPLMELENAWEAVVNNALGTHVVAAAAQAHGVEKFVLVSTDKAVNPTNVMGASKRLAEMMCQALQQSTGTRFVMVRFGNVLGSAGSVIPKFREQIARGGPVTVTHPEITRYFMSIPEAAQLVLQAGLMGQGGEIFVLEMGQPVRIADLAKDLIRLSGLTEEDIRIEYTGLRPGEKLYEELLADDEATLPTPHPKLRIARARSADGEWLARLLAWLRRPDPADDAEVRRDLRAWVPEYAPAIPASGK